MIRLFGNIGKKPQGNTLIKPLLNSTNLNETLKLIDRVECLDYKMLSPKDYNLLMDTDSYGLLFEEENVFYNNFCSVYSNIKFNDINAILKNQNFTDKEKRFIYLYVLLSSKINVQLNDEDKRIIKEILKTLRHKSNILNIMETKISLHILESDEKALKIKKETIISDVRFLLQGANNLESFISTLKILLKDSDTFITRSIHEQLVTDIVFFRSHNIKTWKRDICDRLIVSITYLNDTKSTTTLDDSKHAIKQYKDANKDINLDITKGKKSLKEELNAQLNLEGYDNNDSFGSIKF